MQQGVFELLVFLIFELVLLEYMILPLIRFLIRGFLDRLGLLFIQKSFFIKIFDCKLRICAKVTFK